MNKNLLYAGVMLLLLGAIFLLTGIGTAALGPSSALSMGRLWPLLLAWVGVGFFLPYFIWWERRLYLYGLTFPGIFFLFNAILFLYSSLSGNWGAWAYLWALEPFAVALGLIGLYFFGRRSQPVLIAGLAVGLASLILFAILVSLLAPPMGGLAAGLLLVILGILVLFGGFAWYGRSRRPPDA